MLHKPEQWASEYAEPFQDRSVVEAYRHRPPYPAEVFDILVELIQGKPRHVLDVGCGIGYIARYLVDRVERLDAVDCSWPMIKQGQRLPNGDHPRLRWLYGRVEDIELYPPYALVTAGESLHWMEWSIVLPRFHEVLLPGSYLAILDHVMVPEPWSLLGEILPRYRTNIYAGPYNMLEALEEHGLFHKIGEKMTQPIPFMQSFEDFIESYHSRSGFSRERMGQAQAEAFDWEARSILLRTYSDGVIPFQVAGRIAWGLPMGKGRSTMEKKT
jgi:SAM-dependent methyltransferase